MSTSTGSVSGTLNTFMGNVDSNLNNAITNMPQTPTSADIITLQRAFQEWSLMVSTITSSQKEVADTLKGALAKL